MCITAAVRLYEAATGAAHAVVQEFSALPDGLRAITDWLQTIPGIDFGSACTILAELGPNLEAFREARHLGAWAGVARATAWGVRRRSSVRSTALLVVAGKPSPEFFRAAAASLGLPEAAVLVVGDDVRTEVEGARAAGALGMLVRTGKFREADLDHPAVLPGFVIDSVADLPAALGL